LSWAVTVLVGWMVAGWMVACRRGKSMARVGRLSSGLVSAFPPQSHVSLWEHSGAPSPPSPRCIVYTVLVRVGSVDLEFSCNVNFQHQFDYFITLNCRYHAAWMYKVFTACKMHSKILYKFAHFEITRFQKNLKTPTVLGQNILNLSWAHAHSSFF